MEITLRVPDQYSINYDPVDLGNRMKLYAALLMFKSGELSAGAATEFAEIDRFAFAAECHKWGIPLVDYPPEDLDAELASLRAKA